jgi:hypothetical protein
VVGGRHTLIAMEVPDKLRARMDQPPPPALEQVRSFLGGYVADADGLDEVRTHMFRMAKVNRETVLRDAVAIEALRQEQPRVP